MNQRSTLNASSSVHFNGECGRDTCLDDKLAYVRSREEMLVAYYAATARRLFLFDVQSCNRNCNPLIIIIYKLPLFFSSLLLIIQCSFPRDIYWIKITSTKSLRQFHKYIFSYLPLRIFSCLCVWGWICTQRIRIKIKKLFVRFKFSLWSTDGWQVVFVLLYLRSCFINREYNIQFIYWKLTCFFPRRNVKWTLNEHCILLSHVPSTNSPDIYNITFRNA